LIANESADPFEDQILPTGDEVGVLNSSSTEDPMTVGYLRHGRP